MTAAAAGENNLLSVSTEIQSDLRQIKSDLQSLTMLLKQQQQKPTPLPPFDSDDMNSAESARSGSPEDTLRYLRETQARMMRASEQDRAGPLGIGFEIFAAAQLTLVAQARLRFGDVRVATHSLYASRTGGDWRRLSPCEADSNSTPLLLRRASTAPRTQALSLIICRCAATCTA